MRTSVSLCVRGNWMNPARKATTYRCFKALKYSYATSTCTVTPTQLYVNVSVLEIVAAVLVGYSSMNVWSLAQG
jgi:hypothetical protein